MVHTTPTTLLALTGLAATATAYKHTWRDHMKCAAAVAQDADYPTCTSPSKFYCFCAQPFEPSKISSAAKDVCEGFGIPTESIHRFICDDGGPWGDDDVYGYRISHPHRLSHPNVRVAAPESEAGSSNTDKHSPNVQSKRAYAPGLSPSASSAAANRALVTNAPSALEEDSDFEDGEEHGVRVITEFLTHTSCDCSSSTVAAASSRMSSWPAYVHQSAVPVSSLSAGHTRVHQTLVPVSSSSSHMLVHQTAIPASSSSSRPANLDQVMAPVASSSSAHAPHSAIPVATSSSARAHVYQTAVPASSSSTHMHLHGSAIPQPASSSARAHVPQTVVPGASVSSQPAHLHQAAVPSPSSSSVSASSTVVRSHAGVYAPASLYVSVPVSVPAPTEVDAQRSGYPSRHKSMDSYVVVPSASPSPSPAVMTFDGGAAVGVLVPSSVVVLGLTALMAFFM
ncbi:hypothetical protein KXX16_009099 [Aspergillus fumigatus]|nr:hypothetical protein KXX49_008477 [Aspergillus fumigatus]KAH1647847.1 hypothetical protein KXX16_009099 [Aspergillus fumigatus]KAH1659702.1 hypothetical protein KXX65_004565 [Aspergillus fumigatus]KAH1847713.1 hypothetical protein KXX54_008567 [Aspergillus fumigatus]KAH1858274.1 hypothetical protein KXX55_004930 [Aspergillus fumigatus]